MMTIKEFIEENLNLIDNNDWDIVYDRAQSFLGFNTGEFTTILLDADIHPENYLSELPNRFLSCSPITSFEIPSNIKSINSYVFEYCRNLENITIPDTITSIGSYAFYGCTSLKSVRIGNSVKEIDGGAFQNCDNLTNVIIPNSITSIGDYAFANCRDKLVIDYSGTKSDWKKIYTPEAFDDTYFTIYAIDGEIVKKKR